MALASGTRFGPYEIADEIGAGGMGVVYRATDTTLDREVAIKVLPESMASDAERIVRFEREAKMLASLNHPNIAQIYGLEKADGVTALVLELVEGPTLADRIARGAIPSDEALGIAMQIAEALEAAHSQGIVHRDLKPANIKLRPDGTVKVLDFGIAKALEPDLLTSAPQSPMLTTPATMAGVILGTAAYMSPEQARGKPVDQRADIWAFGCVLYEMLTGQPAFGGEDVPLTLARVLDRDTDLDSLPAAISPAVRQTIQLCLQKDVRKRVADIRDVRLALEGAFETVSPQVTEAAAVAQPAWRRTIPFAATAIAVALITGFGVWLATQPEPPMVTRFDYNLPEGQVFRNTGRRVIAVSPDGRHFVYNTNEGFYLRSMGELEARLISGTGDEARAPFLAPFFSPNSRLIGYYDDDDAQLKQIAISGGAPVVITAVAENLYGASWGTDGTILSSQPEGILRVAATGGTAELIIPTEDGTRFYGPRLLPDGDSVLFSVGPPDDDDAAQIVVESLSTGERKVLVEGGSNARYLPTGHLVYAFEDGLFAVAFDLDNLTVTVSGGVVPLVQGVMRAGFGATHYDVSENGTLVYVAGDVAAVERTLVWVDREGREEAIPIQPSGYAYPQMSPDGLRVILGDQNAADNNLWIWDFVGETRTRLTIGENVGILPVWTPNGTRIAYGSYGGDIDWKAANNTGSVERLATGVAGAGPPMPYFFSRSGDELVFRSPGNPETGDDIGMIIVGSDAEPVWLLQGPYDELNAELSPDGRWMAYQSNESGNYEIYVRPFPNVDGDQVPVSTAGGYKPLWSRDGRELFYLDPGPPVRLMSASVVATETAFSVGTRSSILDWPYRGLQRSGRQYDVSPDGQQFLAIKESGTEDASARIIVVQNWFEEVRRLVPTE